ncbi:Gfo/Idh/MocA family oxidoreductase [Kineosporia sp. NBRC 101731]|uniref:Gfo/Idh/MocA family protein n=1 Tax=Kineosporia sp. NBRC 101731 TaxID=3032199 RepID=UPI0024A53D26|nr:Gfo/Idh/MocA family oxidoreductase [Kineosporia sp. NBRC 101731]GLY28955.1 oxidoreductase [Kineosporia sp. NBRC 101731]
MTFLPNPRELPTAPSLRWGLLGPGGIAASFVDAAHRHSQQRFVNVASGSSPQRATAFAQAHGVTRSSDTYEQVLADPEVDAVYIATTHDSHAQLALLAIAAGKHVMVEKPLTTTRADAQKVVDAARAAGLFAMEAMWTRYLPQSDVLRQLLERGDIGEVRLVTADFGFPAQYDPASRLWAPGQAGGALLDAGVYPVSFVSSVLGSPSAVHTVGTLAPTGVDEQATVTLAYEKAQGVAFTSLRTAAPTRASVIGTEGRIDIDGPFLAPSGLGVTMGAGFPSSAQTAHWSGSQGPQGSAALSYEADAMARYLSEGLTESPIHPLDEVVSVVGILEEARQQLGAV